MSAFISPFARASGFDESDITNTLRSAELANSAELKKDDLWQLPYLLQSNVYTSLFGVWKGVLSCSRLLQQNAAKVNNSQSQLQQLKQLDQACENAFKRYTAETQDLLQREFAASSTLSVADKNELRLAAYALLEELQDVYVMSGSNSTLFSFLFIHVFLFFF